MWRATGERLGLAAAACLSRRCGSFGAQRESPVRVREARPGRAGPCMLARRARARGPPPRPARPAATSGRQAPTRRRPRRRRWRPGAPSCRRSPGDEGSLAASLGAVNTGPNRDPIGPHGQSVSADLNAAQHATACGIAAAMGPPHRMGSPPAMGGRPRPGQGPPPPTGRASRPGRSPEPGAPPQPGPQPERTKSRQGQSDAAIGDGDSCALDQYGFAYMLSRLVFGRCMSRRLRWPHAWQACAHHERSSDPTHIFLRRRATTHDGNRSA